MAIITGLVGYWALNETGPGIGTPDTFFPALDAQGSNPLTDVGSCGSTAGKVGLCRSFSGVNYFTHASNATLQAGNIAISFSVWFYQTGTIRMMVVTKDAGEYPNDYSLSITAAPGTQFNFGVGGDQWIYAPTHTLNAWHHVVCGYDPVTGLLWMYLDGVEVPAVSIAGLNTPIVTAAAFQIGSAAWTTTRLMIGRIDEVGFWKRRLSAADAAWLYNGGAGRSYADIVAEQTQAVSGAPIPSASVARSPVLAQLPPVKNDTFVWLL